MEEKRGRAVDKYLLLLGNYSLRSTDPLAVLSLSLSSTPSIYVRLESTRRRGGEEERREG